MRWMRDGEIALHQPMSNGHAYRLRGAEPRDWESIRSLLADSDLPVEDLDAEGLDNFLVAVDTEEIVGMIGLEPFGRTGLLRSLVVAGNVRCAGLGGDLVTALESSARGAGIESLWLLTIDAERFFEGRGYSIVERDAAPDRIRQTKEFSELCPGTAHLMTKTLAT